MGQIRVIPEDEVSAIPEGICQSKWGRNACQRPAAFILCVTTNNGFAVMCAEHREGYRKEHWDDGVTVIPYSPEKVAELLEIARVRGWHNELVDAEDGQ